MFRKTLFWMHLTAGSVAGLVILMMSVTGVILTYERQMQAWEDNPYYADPEPGQQRLTVDELLNTAKQLDGFTATSLIVSSRADAPFVASMGRSQTLHMNPYTAEIYQPHSDALSGFFSDVRSLHRWFLVSGDGRATARDITGAANLLFLFLLLSGTYLWLPKVFNWATLKTRIWFNPQANNAQARDFNWHHVFAFWAAIPLLVVIPTATVFNYGWANDLVYTLAGDTPPERARPEALDPLNEPTRTQSLETLLATATSYKEDWQTISFSLPEPGAQTISLTIDEGDGGQPQLRHSLTLDRISGAEISWVPFTDQAPGVQARRWVRFLHTGEALGLPGQTIAGIASAAGAMLVWTGLALALRRFSRWRVRNRKSANQASNAKELAT